MGPYPHLGVLDMPPFINGDAAQPEARPKQPKREIPIPWVASCLSLRGFRNPSGRNPLEEMHPPPRSDSRPRAKMTPPAKKKKKIKNTYIYIYVYLVRALPYIYIYVFFAFSE